MWQYYGYLHRQPDSRRVISASLIVCRNHTPLGRNLGVICPLGYVTYCIDKGMPGRVGV